jgi:site-specific recombinase XerD
MTRQKNNELLSLVESFFGDHLKGSCGASHHTIRAYRDTLRLFFCFIANYKGCEVANLRLDDLQVENVAAFLTHLEVKRGNTAASRNYRLAAIRSFIKHLVRHDLQRAQQYQRILALPSKKTHTPVATYLEPEDVRLILKQPDRRTPAGVRDHALLIFLYNTGARVSEALSVRVGDISLANPRQVRLHGKGGKERLCPLWRDTANSLQRLPAVREGNPRDPLFCNRDGNALSRDGVAYILRKHATHASLESPALRRCKITPHTLRHSCAVALLQAGVDVSVIRDYLGHASIATTSRYITTNLQMKRDALEKFWRQSGLSPVRPVPWKPNPDLLSFLSSL